MEFRDVFSVGLGSGVPYLNTFLLVPVPLWNHYEIKVYSFFSLVTSKSRECWCMFVINKQDVLRTRCSSHCLRLFVPVAE